MNFAKKTGLGYKDVSIENISESTHIVFSVDEYQNFLKKHENAVLQLKKLSDETIKNLEKEFSSYKEKSEFEYRHDIQVLQSVRDEMKDRIDLLKSQLQKSETKYNAEYNLNKTLLRIVKERANASRHLSPKKKHCGYVVFTSEQWDEKYYIEQDFIKWREIHKFADKADFHAKEYYQADVWRSVIQTPYDACIPLLQIQERVEADLSVPEIAAVLGYENIVENHINGDFRGFRACYEKEINVLYKWTYKANFKSGYWELYLFTTKPLTVT